MFFQLLSSYLNLSVTSYMYRFTPIVSSICSMFTHSFTTVRGKSQIEDQHPDLGPCFDDRPKKTNSARHQNQIRQAP